MTGRRGQVNDLAYRFSELRPAQRFGHTQIAAGAFEEEKIACPQSIRLFPARRLKVNGQRVRVWPAG